MGTSYHARFSTGGAQALVMRRDEHAARRMRGMRQNTSLNSTSVAPAPPIARGFSDIFQTRVTQFDKVTCLPRKRLVRELNRRKFTRARQSPSYISVRLSRVSISPIFTLARRDPDKHPYDWFLREKDIFNFLSIIVNSA